MASATFQLDNIIHVLGLTKVDADSEGTAPRFVEGSPPVMGRQRGTRAASPERLLHSEGGRPGERAGKYIQYHSTPHPTPFDSHRDLSVTTTTTTTTTSSPTSLTAPRSQTTTTTTTTTTKQCACTSISMSSAPDQARSTPLWLMTPKWEVGASEAEYRREEARRLVWSAMTLIGGDLAARAARGEEISDLWVTRVEEFRLAYPGERVFEKEVGRGAGAKEYVLVGRRFFKQR